MQTQSKITLLKQALLNGEVTTPLLAWNRWRMAHNTYHRSIHSLRHGKDAMKIASTIVENDGVRHSKHWVTQ